MVDGSAICCEGTAMVMMSIGQRQIRGNFYVVSDIPHEIICTDVLGPLNAQTNVANRQLRLNGVEVPTFQPPASAQSSARLVKFARVYAARQTVIAPGCEETIWGRTHYVKDASGWVGVLEQNQNAMDHLGLLACATVTIAGKDKKIPLRVCNVTEDWRPDYNSSGTELGQRY